MTHSAPRISERFKSHAETAAREPEERLCVCLHSYDDHIFRGSRLVCEETEAGERCSCREFACWLHPDNDCFEEPSHD